MNGRLALTESMILRQVRSTYKFFLSPSSYTHLNEPVQCRGCVFQAEILMTIERIHSIQLFLRVPCSKRNKTPLFDVVLPAAMSYNMKIFSPRFVVRVDHT